MSLEHGLGLDCSGKGEGASGPPITPHHYVFDFKNGTYTVDGSDAGAVTNVFESNVNTGPFNPADDIVPGSGLINFSGSGQASMKSPFYLDLIANGFSAIVTTSGFDAGLSGEALILFQNGETPFHFVNCNVSASGTDGSMNALDLSSGNNPNFLNFTAASSMKWGISYVGGVFLSGSPNGDITTGANDPGLGQLSGILIQPDFAPTYVEKVEFFSPALSNAALQAATA
jgi:hypothetical protein